VLVVLSMFQYIVCDRALLSGGKGAEGFYTRSGFTGARSPKYSLGVHRSRNP